jgi:hypothetical protein
MIILHTLAVALALAIPPDKPMPPDPQPPRPGQPDRPGGAEQPAPGSPGTPAPGTPAQTPGATTTQSASVRNEVLPAIVGIRSGNLAAMALHELASGDALERQAARNTMRIANDAVDVAQDSARDLDQMRALSDELRDDADTAAKKLAEANATVDRLQRELGRATGPMPREDAEAVRKHAAQLHGQLLEAERSLTNIAEQYGIDLELTAPERAAAKTTEQPRGPQP